MTKDEALKLALEAITTYLSESPDASEEAVEGLWDAVNVARKALAQPEQKEKFCDSNCVWTDHHPDCNLAQPPYRAVKTYHGGKPVYVAEPEQVTVQRLSALVRAQQITIDKLEAQRTWVGLIHDERYECVHNSEDGWDVTEATEAKLKEKNT